MSAEHQQISSEVKPAVMTDKRYTQVEKALITEFLPLAKGEYGLSYGKVTKRINTIAKERGLNCREFKSSCVYRFAKYKPSLTAKVHKRKRIERAANTESVTRRGGNNPLSWPDFAEHVNATAKHRGLECREFTGMNLADNFSVARRNNPTLPSGWTKVERDLVVECAFKFKGVALAQRMNETAQGRGLKCRDFTRQIVSNFIGSARSTGKPLLSYQPQPQNLRWTQVDEDLFMGCPVHPKGIALAERMNGLAEGRDLDRRMFTAENVSKSAAYSRKIARHMPPTQMQPPPRRLTHTGKDLLRKYSANFPMATPSRRINELSRKTGLHGLHSHDNSHAFDLRALSEGVNDIAYNEEQYDTESEKGDNVEDEENYFIGNEGLHGEEDEDGDFTMDDQPYSIAQLAQIAHPSSKRYWDTILG